MKVRAHRPSGAADHAADALEPRDRGGQWEAVVGASARGDHRVGAQGDGEVRDHTQGVVDVDSLEHLLGCPAVAQLLSRPTVEGRAVSAARLVDGADVRRRAAGEH